MEAYSENDAAMHYELHLRLDPPLQMLEVTGTVLYRSMQARLERARFYLHSQFAIRKITGKRVSGFQFRPHPSALGPVQGMEDAPAPLPDEIPSGVATHAGILDIYFNPPLARGESTPIQVEYAGYLTDWPADSTNIITPEWTELGQALPWYPVELADTPNNLTFRVRIHLPDGYQAASYGNGDVEAGEWYYHWYHPTQDLVIVAAPNLELRTLEGDANKVFVAGVRDDPVAASLGDEALWCLERFSGWFGRIRPPEFRLILSPRRLGGNYARPGLAVLANLSANDLQERPEIYFHFLARTLARAWWWEAPADTWESWLNESFVEYSAMMAVRERFNADIGARMVSFKQKRAAELPPLWEFTARYPIDGDTLEAQSAIERALYDQGPLLLHRLAERVGYRRFLDICRARLWGGVLDTQHFLEIIGEVEDDATRQWFEAQLRG